MTEPKKYVYPQIKCPTEDMITVKQLAEQLGVSKNALQKKMKNPGIAEAIAGGIALVGTTKYLNKDARLYLESLYIKSFADVTIAKKVPVAIPKSVALATDEDYSRLQSEVDRQAKQIKEQKVQIDELIKLLENEQKLHLLDKQRLVMLEQKQEKDVHVSFLDKLKGMFRHANPE